VTFPNLEFSGLRRDYYYTLRYVWFPDDVLTMSGPIRKGAYAVENASLRVTPESELTGAVFGVVPSLALFPSKVAIGVPFAVAVSVQRADGASVPVRLGRLRTIPASVLQPPSCYTITDICGVGLNSAVLTIAGMAFSRLTNVGVYELVVDVPGLDGCCWKC